jgi:hypothetical protein
LKSELQWLTWRQSTVCGTSRDLDAKLWVSLSPFSHIIIGLPSRAVTCCRAFMHFYKYKKITIKLKWNATTQVKGISYNPRHQAYSFSFPFHRVENTAHSDLMIHINFLNAKIVLIFWLYILQCQSSILLSCFCCTGFI